MPRPASRMGLVPVLEHVVQGKKTCRIVSVYYLKEVLCLLYLPSPYALGISKVVHADKENSLSSRTFQKTLKVATVEVEERMSCCF